MSDLFFNINNLITPTIEMEIENISDISEKTDYLFKLIEYTSHFPPETIDEIRNFWIEKTGEKYTPVFISSDEKELVYEHIRYFPDFSETKKLINCIATEFTKEECIASAVERISIAKQQLEQEQKEAATSIFDELSFDDEPENNAEHRQSLNTRLAEAEKKVKNQNK